MQRKRNMMMTRTLVGDLGGTNTRFAISVRGQDALTNVRQYPNADFKTFDDVLSHYLTEIGAPDVEGVCIAAAGPVADGELRMTNISWVLSEAALRRRLGVDVALLINDLQAFAYALELIGDGDLDAVVNADAPKVAGGQKLVVNLGTGFNVSATASSVGGKVLALRSEFGHAAMSSAVRTGLEPELSADDIRELATFEHLFCGRGLEWLFRKLAGDGRTMSGKEIVDAATSATPDPDSLRTVTVYSRMMGLMCADMVKAFLPTGGIYFSGSVATMLRHKPLSQEFAASFEGAPSLPNLPKHIFCGIINDPFAALKGCSVLIESET
jgi:glucokinase